MSASRLWTFGHSTRTSDETVRMLRAAGVRRVIDVRSIRGSRHNPWFAAEQMAHWLGDADIDFLAVSALGGRRRRQPIDPEVNAGWTQESFHRFADYTLSNEFEEGLAELATHVDVPAAIMCAEAVPWRCHRSLIATVLTVRGWHVTHLLGVGQSLRHEFGRWGATPVVGDDGRIRYPRRSSAP